MAIPLLVMNALAEGELPGLKGQVQCIIIDPPYGIKFGSNWQATTRNRNVKDGKIDDVSREPEVIRAFRDTWEKGIHTYLTYWRDRLTIARELLTESGSIFVQISDVNSHLVRGVLDEVFGSGNFCGQINVTKTAGQTDELLPSVSDLLLWYAKAKEQVKFRKIYRMKGVGVDELGQYYYVQLPSGEGRSLSTGELKGTVSLPDGGRPFRISDLSSNKFYSLGEIPFQYQGRMFIPPSGRYWTYSPAGRERLKRAERLYAAGNSIRFMGYLDDFPCVEVTNRWDDTGVSGFSDAKIYVVQTNTKVYERCILMTTDPSDIVLDPTCGSGTTATVAEQWGRRWITIDSSRVALALARTRLMAAKYPAYLLADSGEGHAKEQAVTGKMQPDSVTLNDVRKGFVYERVPRVTLKSIANNEEIDVIYERWQATLEPMRASLNAACGTNWESWQIPREPGEAWHESACALLAEYWKGWIGCKKENDANIARRAETVYLYDKPYENNKAVRVCGPFTV